VGWARQASARIAPRYAPASAGRWVHALLDQGTTIRAISRELGLARGTARRFARAESVDELLVNNRTGYRVSVLEVYKPDLHRRWNEGCTNATQLFEEIKALGYTGGEKMVRTYLQPFRALAHIPVSPPKPPTVRKVVGWILTNPETLRPSTGQVSNRFWQSARNWPYWPGTSARSPRSWASAAAGNSNVDECRRLRRPTGTALVRPRPAPRPGRSRHRTDIVLEQRNRRRSRQPNQDAQTTDVRPSEDRPIEKANPVERLNNAARNLTKIVPDPRSEPSADG
jgi:hypothetical protein